MKTRVQCPECRSYLRRQLAGLVGSRKGESFEVEMDALVCPKCGFKTVPREHAAEFALRTADAYREAHDLWTSREIKDARKRLGMTQAVFTKFLRVGDASPKRWELGEIQSPAMNHLMVLAVEAEERRRMHAYRPWGGFEQLQEKTALQLYNKRDSGISGMSHGPPLLVSEITCK
jgi:putative zinc finger/helix-turn-helix YgiT family protein